MNGSSFSRTSTRLILLVRSKACGMRERPQTMFAVDGRNPASPKKTLVSDGSPVGTNKRYGFNLVATIHRSISTHLPAQPLNMAGSGKWNLRSDSW